MKPETIFICDRLTTATLQQLVDDLADFARKEANLRERVALTALVEELVRTYRLIGPRPVTKRGKR